MSILISYHDLVNQPQPNLCVFALINSLIYRIIKYYHETLQPSFTTEAPLLPDPVISTIGSASFCVLCKLCCQTKTNQ